MYYYARTHKAAQTASTIKSVTCEKCECAYSYRMVRRGEGTGMAPYGLGNEAAKLRAQRSATQKLKKLLERGIDPVACPDCGWIQDEMVREVRRRRYFPLVLWGILLSFLLAIVLFFWWMFATNAFKRDLRPDERLPITILAGLLAFSIAGPLALRRFLQQRLDPNRHYPSPPDPIAGAPKAFKPGEMVETLEETPDAESTGGVASLEYARRPPEVEPGGWVTVQLLNVPVPARCCSCMIETQRVQTFKPRDLVTVPVRLCAQCRKQATMKRWLWGIGVTIVFAALAFVAGFAFHVKHMDEQIIYAIPAAIFGGVLGALIGYRTASPVVFGGFDSTLNTIRMRFRNPNYVAAFAVAAADNSVPIPSPGFTVALPRPKR